MLLALLLQLLLLLLLAGWVRLAGEGGLDLHACGGGGRVLGGCLGVLQLDDISVVIVGTAAAAVAVGPGCDGGAVVIPADETGFVVVVIVAVAIGPDAGG